MSDKPADFEFFHIRHSCGHAVYWSSAQVAMRVEAAPCPWCGAEDGRKVPAEMNLLHDRRLGVLTFRELENGQVPWPSDMSGPDGDIVLRHRADETCCTPAPAAAEQRESST